MEGAAAIDPRAGDRVELIGLRRAYGRIPALDDLSLEIGASELVVLLGPSGCGKTTALRALAGLERLDAGRIMVGGIDITDVPASRRNMGMVFQAYSLFPHMTALENIAFGLRLHGVGAPERSRIARRFLETVGLGDRARRYPHQLSGGQQQRVALARALAFGPRVLLLDEPLSALDAKVRSQLRHEIRRIQRELGTTALFVTHDQEEAMAIADRVAVMHAGRIEQIAAPADLYARPRTVRVAEFVGLTSRLKGRARDGMVTVLGSTVPLLEGSAGEGDVAVLVRPEAVVLAPDPEGNGRVVEASFLGAIARVEVRLPDGTPVLAQVQSSEIAEFPPGSAVRVSVRAMPVLAVKE